MPNGLPNLAALIGRLLLAILFIKFGFDKVTGFNGTVGYIASHGLPMPSVLAALATIVELGGGILIAVGLFTRWAALALAAFCVLTSVLFHAFWAAPEAGRMGEQIEFLKDFALAGGLLVLAAFGAGALSVDAKRNAA
jgi:putative oxidoreductase